MEKEIKEKISEGWIHARAIIEVLGKPKEHVEATLKQYVGQIKENAKNIKIIDEYYSEPKEQGENKELFSVFVELEFIAKDPSTLVWLSFDYMPSSIEIIEPDDLRYKKKDFSALINDLLARLHDVDMKFKNAIMESNLINKSNTILLRRIITVSLKHGGKSLEELSEESGLGQKELFLFLGEMISEKIIKKEGEKYMPADG